MFDHLVEANEADFVPLVEDVVSPRDVIEPVKETPSTHLAARIATASILDQLHGRNDTEIVVGAERAAAQAAFVAFTTNTEPAEAHALLERLDAPPAVKHLVGMLTAYDWEFVHRAQEIRGYAVSKILEETTHPEPKVRLRALEMLGKVTEVALFTERVEVKKTGMSDEELDRKIRDKLKAIESLSDAIVLDEKKKQADDGGAHGHEGGSGAGTAGDGEPAPDAQQGAETSAP